MPKLNALKDIKQVSAILIYGFLGVLGYFTYYSHSLPPEQQVQFYGYYLPILIASLYMFIAGVNWTAALYTDRIWLILCSVLQYCYLIYFCFIIKVGFHGYSILEYYRRAIYFIPVILIQLWIDKKLKSDGTFTVWFFRQKLLANCLILGFCIWNYFAFEYYFNLDVFKQ